MVAHADAVSPEAAASASWPSASWVDRLVTWLDDRPGPTWLAYLALGAIGIAVGNAISWLGGATGTLSPYWSGFGVAPVIELALIRYLDRVAATALDTFRPLLDRDEAAFNGLLRRFTTLPAGPTAVLTLVVVGLGLGHDLQDPAAHRLVGVGPLAAILIAAMEIPINSLLAVFVVKSIRHYIDVARVHREAPRIDLLNPAPLYAFSRLTSQTALGMLFLVASFGSSIGSTYVASAAVTAASRALLLSSLIGMVAGATAMFVLPLYGMHRRIVLEKDRLQAASGARLASILAELDRDIRKFDLARADGLNKLLASVLSERDLLARLPTWPWQAATLRAFISALLLPVLVYLMARAAERVVL